MMRCIEFDPLEPRCMHGCIDLDAPLSERMVGRVPMKRADAERNHNDLGVASVRLSSGTE